MSRRFQQVLINAQTAANTVGLVGGNTASAISGAAQCTEYGIYVEFDGTSAAGTVLIETASSPTYSGTWAVLATVNWGAANKSHYVALTNSLLAVRARISSAITSGTVTVTAVGNTAS